MELTLTKLPYVDTAELFAQIAHRPWAMMLDSGTLNGRASSKRSWGFDVLAMRPQVTLVYDGELTCVTAAEAQENQSGDPLEVLRATLPPIENADSIDSPYLPGAIGYFSYDLARCYERIPTSAKDDEQLPPMAMGIFYVVLVVDHSRQQSLLIQMGDDPDVSEIAEQWRELVHKNESGDETPIASQHKIDARWEGLQCGPLQENIDRPRYRQLFDRVRDYTIEGDCYQVNLTKRFAAKASGDAWLTYRSLREASPAPYGAYFNLPFAQILSNSPESFIECRNRQVVTSPIKGTKARSHDDPSRDFEIAQSLLESEKDRAENLMIVDLMRNDLSRCCELGSVSVPSLFDLHSFANVHHLISTVTGTLRADLHSLDLLRACFPGGSITGAPKIRAMEIIEELEPHRRGLYCGAIGYIGVDGSLSTNIAIRTIVVKDGVARYSAGGGLVIDSDVDDEYQELLDKARMMTDALYP